MTKSPSINLALPIHNCLLDAVCELIQHTSESEDPTNNSATFGQEMREPLPGFRYTHFERREIVTCPDTSGHRILMSGSFVDVFDILRDTVLVADNRMTRFVSVLRGNGVQIILKMFGHLWQVLILPPAIKDFLEPWEVWPECEVVDLVVEIQLHDHGLAICTRRQVLCIEESTNPDVQGRSNLTDVEIALDRAAFDLLRWVGFISLFFTLFENVIFRQRPTSLFKRFLDVLTAGATIVLIDVRLKT